MRFAYPKYFGFCSIIALLGVAFLYHLNHKPPLVPGSVRHYHLQRARVWHPVDVRSANIVTGPRNQISAPPESEVLCRYVEPHEKTAGATPKFLCRLFDSGEVVRIKYRRRETFAEVAANRLLWALGFYADENYPVRLRCMGCPGETKSEPRGEKVFEDAVMERNFPGITLDEFEDQGWSWKELDEVDPRLGGSSRAEVDALKLLGVFIQHLDSKSSQQRLACYSEDIIGGEEKRLCRKPVLMIQDPGASFGIGATAVTASSSMYFKGWSHLPIWKPESEKAYADSHQGRTICIGNITSAFKDGLFDPQISEDGRKLLAGQMNQLSDQQIGDMFRISRVERLNEQIEEDGKMRPVLVEDWVAAFKKKREEISNRTCQ